MKIPEKGLCQKWSRNGFAREKVDFPVEWCGKPRIETNVLMKMLQESFGQRG